MNRILTAEVILTLTRKQAGVLVWALRTAHEAALVPDTAELCSDLAAVVFEQCAKQGVQL